MFVFRAMNDCVKKVAKIMQPPESSLNVQAIAVHP